MDAEQLRSYCLSKALTEEDTPFGPDVVAFKVLEKAFALLALDEIPIRVNLKCDPQRALLLREQWPAVLPGYHMNKKHWNTVQLDGSVPYSTLAEWIDHSYERVVAGMTKKQQHQVDAAGGLQSDTPS
jgi:predicted DNA-binding protein (MmcQ/YjbR family)